MEIDNEKKFTELFDELEDCDEEQKQKILEMNETMEEMDEDECKSVFTIELFNKINKMIGEKRINLKCAILLLKHMGYCNNLKRVFIRSFEESSLSERFENLIDEEDQKKEEKDEKLLVDLCECYLLLSHGLSCEILSICIRCLLKDASDKEKKKKIQKDVEIALLALSSIYEFYEVRQELFLNEIKQIIKYHHEHNNLTRLAYLSVWEFLIRRLLFNENLKDIVANELYFVKEARRELEELTKCANRKRKGKMKEGKEDIVIFRWLILLMDYLSRLQLKNEEIVGLMGSIVKVLRVAKDNNREISKQCMNLLQSAAYSRDAKVENLLECGAADVVLEEIIRLDAANKLLAYYLTYFRNLCAMLIKKTESESDNAKRKETKRKLLEKMEEEGFEDCIVALSSCFVNGSMVSVFLVGSIEQYFVHC